ncbi:DNA polymerase II large subunit [Haloferax larsenii]|uniref:DNA polymerase II large subunit n=1 Tax=Haloferax larsenii TaxID=302484 RepID=A0ABY5RFT3_HALLR|nr:DNA polymerase II large subunit [Haloferax larsenii]UVE51237.1 DNA polymerase II large subunit [Haloferax larsenii]
MREEEERYFGRIEGRLDEAFEVARAAKQQGHDPKRDVEIPVAKDMADRVENILGIDGVAERVRELEGEMSREEAALELVTDFVDGNVGDYDSREGKVEGAVRTAVALLTEGVVAAPIEGIDRVEILENDDGTEFVNVYYAGPIRSAGGTAQALSVLVADYARSLLGIDEYKGRDDEIERYVEEINLYDKETGLQYSPKDKETRFIATNMPIMLDGEATGDEEVSGFRDLERVDTNSARGGMCLVMAEGIALKAPKIQRYTRQLDEVEWPWLQDLIDGTIGKDDGKKDESEAEAESEAGDADEDDADAAEADDAHDEPEGPPRVEPATKFLRDLIAGRPVFGHPSAPGGFRLRYGRARNHGFATAGVHPATMHIVDDFIATGTQIKTERPGKAGGVVPVDSIEGPTVRLANGDVRRIDDPEEAEELQNGVEKIIDLGEYLVNFGEFVENNHPLAPASYVFEWWIQDFETTDANVQALRDDPTVSLDDPTVEEALAWAEQYDAPLHPKFTYLWHDISVEQYDALTDVVAAGEIVAAEADGGQPRGSRAGGGRADGGGIAVEPEDGNEGTLVVENTPEIRETLENLLVEHRQTDEELRIPIWRPLARSLGLADDRARTWSLDDLSARAREWEDGDNAVEAVNEIAPFEVRERAPTRIGGRMGRPEKSERRDLSPAVHTLFPIGEAGGSQRDVGDAARKFGESGKRGEVSVRLGKRKCPDCGQFGFKPKCSNCGGHTKPHYECDDCGTVIQPDESGRVYCDRCEWDVESAEWQTVDLNTEYRDALESVGERESSFEILKGVKGLTSSNKTPEPIEKGVLRAKHDVSSFKDGTVRYDMTDLPVTAVRPEELDVTADHFRELGYETDIDGEPLRFDDQLVELKVQDIVLSKGAAKHMMQTANFVDDLLEQFYGLEPFYKMDERDDLIGELVFGMAPHTSAAVVGRVVGFTTAAVGYAHPYFHAAKRRNCFHPETKVWYRDEDDEWHFGDVLTLVEERLSDPETDDFGTLVQEIGGDVLVPSLTRDGRETYKPVEAVSKHVAPDQLVRIETHAGRELTVTPDHTMIRADGDQFERVPAHEVGEGDAVPSPKSVELDSDPFEFDLLEEFLAGDSIPAEDLMVRGLGKERIQSLFDEYTGKSGYLKPVAELLDCGDSTVYNWVSRDSVPASVFIELFGDTDAVVDTLPNDVSLGIRRDTATVSRTLEIDEEFGTVLGYYAAEGFTRADSGNFYQTTICIPDEVARDHISETLSRTLGIEAFDENEWKLTVSSRLVESLFTDVLGLGSRAKDKHIPDTVLSGPNSVLRSFLAAYFSGDGSASADRVEIRAHTVSDELKRDLVAALKRFGIATKTYSERRVPRTGALAEFYDTVPEFDTWVLKVTSENAVRFADEIGYHLPRKEETLTDAIANTEIRTQRLFADGGDTWLDEIVSVEYVESDVDHTYSLTVEETNSLVAHDLYVGQCDGDEDCVMLLMDGLLNFSKEFLPDKRGGQMDAPLVMSSRIDPSEIDDEAHNMDIVRQYPREFYEATRRMEDPDDWEDEVTIAEEYLGTDREYTGFDHTHDTTDIAAGPDLSAYKTLGSMMDKMDAQLFLARKLRAVDETDVAERVIEYHFLPDLIGNLRAFSRQETRCLDCGEKYRRMPLTGECRECGGRVNLTVHQGSVNKYMDTAIQVAEEFDCRDYTKQRLEVLEKSLESIFENDKNKQSGIADFM